MDSEQYLNFEHGLSIIAHVFTTNTNKSFTHKYIVEIDRKLQHIIVSQHKNLILISVHTIKEN